MWHVSYIIWMFKATCSRHYMLRMQWSMAHVTYIYLGVQSCWLPPLYCQLHTRAPGRVSTLATSKTRLLLCLQINTSNDKMSSPGRTRGGAVMQQHQQQLEWKGLHFSKKLLCDVYVKIGPNVYGCIFTYRCNQRRFCSNENWDSKKSKL